MQAREAPRREKSQRLFTPSQYPVGYHTKLAKFARLNFQTRHVYSETYDCGRGAWLARIPTIPNH